MPAEPTTTIGGYRIISRLGEGGMGEVFLAQDDRLQRRVAIKRLLPAAGADAHAGRRLITEARAAGKLDHPNICSVYEVGEDNGAPFIVMPVVEGETLASRLQAGPLPIPEAVSIAAQVADALAAAHAQEILHRDIKPANLMIGARSHVRVMDFGVASFMGPAAAETATRLTLPGSVIGTVAYMSPEQARGEHLDARNDPLNPSVVFFATTCGSRPFDRATTVDGLMALLAEPVPPLATLRAGAPQELQRILSKALQKSRDDRYQSAADLQADLRNLLRALEGASGQTTLVSTATAPRRRVFPVALAVIGVLVAGALIWTLAGNRTAAPPASAGVVVIDALAVLPLANNSGDAQKEYVADGITQTLIASLSRLPNLKVISRNSVFAFKGKTMDAKAIARELGVGAVMTGVLSEADGQLVIDVELSDASDAGVIFSHRYLQQRGSGVLAMQSEIARDVASKLQLKLTGEEQRQLATLPTQNPEAYQHFLRGLSYVRQGTPAGLHQAIASYQKAVTLDPAYAQAYASMAQAYLELGLFFEAPHQTMPKARELANQAIRVDPNLPDANIALGLISLVYDWDWDAAVKVMTASAAWSTGALEMFSCSAHLLASTGRGPEAEHELKRALLTDPLSAALRNEMGCGAYYRRRYDDAIREGRAALDYDPNGVVAYWGLGRALGQQKKYREALDELHMVEKRVGEAPSLILAEIGYVLAASGRADEARAVLRKLDALASIEFVDPYTIAAIHMGLGDTPRTLASLEEAFAAKSGFMVSLASEPKWDGIRSHPQFRAILKRVGF